MQLRDAAKIMNGQLIGSDVVFSAVSTDTRTLNRGDLFFALQGDNFDGEKFSATAEKKSACAVVTSKPLDVCLSQIVVSDTTKALGALAKYKRQQIKAKVIAITGSTGKTSVKGMLANILSTRANTGVTHGNLNNHIGVPLTILGASDDLDYLVVEAGTSGRGEIKYLADIIDPDIALVNNVQSAHMEGFGSLEAIADEKSDLLVCGKRSCIPVLPDFLFNMPALTQKITREKSVVFSDEKNDIDENFYADEINSSEGESTCFRLHHKQAHTAVELHVPGLHQVHNAMAAAACAHTAGVSLDDIARGLKGYKGEKGRMQYRASSAFKLVDDSYNASPSSMRAAIDFLSEQKNAILVAGDMGELGPSAPLEHQYIGAYARQKKIAHMCAVGDYADNYKKGYGNSLAVCKTKEDAANYAVRHATAISTILVKGSRFMHMEDICERILEIKRGYD